MVLLELLVVLVRPEELLDLTVVVLAEPEEPEAQVVLEEPEETVELLVHLEVLDLLEKLEQMDSLEKLVLTELAVTVLVELLV